MHAKQTYMHFTARQNGPSIITTDTLSTLVAAAAPATLATTIRPAKAVALDHLNSGNYHVLYVS